MVISLLAIEMVAGDKRVITDGYAETNLPSLHRQERNTYVCRSGPIAGGKNVYDRGNVGPGASIVGSSSANSPLEPRMRKFLETAI
jgi:hypothetical protein